MTINENITIELNINEFWLIINGLDSYQVKNMNHDWYQGECDYLMDKLFDMAREQGVVEE